MISTKTGIMTNKTFFTSADLYAGTQLRKLRKARGFSQVALAEALGVSFQQIQKYERGLNRLSAGKIDMISNFFNISVMYFFNVQESSLEIVKLFNRCDKERQKILLALAQTYSEEQKS